MANYNEAKILKAIRNSAGIKSTIAKRLGCSRMTLDKWIRENEVVKEAYDDENEKINDLAESKLFEQMQMGNLGAIIYRLKTKAKDRGYVERGEENRTVTIKFEDDATEPNGYD